MKDKTELIGRTKLPELARFSELRGVEPGESFDLSLATTNHPVICLTSAENANVARDYGYIIGREIAVVSVDNPIQEAIQLKTDGEIPLVFHSATDPILNEKMFADGPRLGQLLMGHLYVPTANHKSPSLYAIGVANQGINILARSIVHTDDLGSIKKQMESRRRDILGENLSNSDFRRILQSPSVYKVIAHALGPKGTNISQAMEQYVKSLGIEGKTDLIVHPKGIEPMEYAEMARSEVEPGVIPIHMECAVYYDMAKLFDQRTNEVVFADHHYMPLDVMQLASITDIEELAAGRKMRIATHPSPKPLIDPWVNSGNAEWIKATSNSAAAQMVISSEADACITTGSGLREAQGLTSRHVFGSPIMLFTIATPLNQEQLRWYLRAV